MSSIKKTIEELLAMAASIEVVAKQRLKTLLILKK